MAKTKVRKKNYKKRTIKKKHGNKKYGGVSRRQMNKIENWKQDMSRPQKKKMGKFVI